MPAALDLSSQIATMGATLIAALALLFAIHTHNQARRSERRATCFSMHQLWFSPQMYDARTRASRICEKIEKGRSAASYRSNKQFISDVSHVEHFMVDLCRLLDAGLVDRELARSLFHANLASWVRRLEATVYHPACLHPFHPGKDAPTAHADFRKKVVPVLHALTYRTPLERAMDAMRGTLRALVPRRRSAASPRTERAAPAA